MATTTVSLWRSVRSEQFTEGTIIDNQPAPGVLNPDFYRRELGKGRFREPDVVLHMDDNGVEWIQPDGGTSLFDKENALPGGGWLSFNIPDGTVIPDSLIVKNTGYNKRFKATHYQIECNIPMTMEAFIGALDNFARSAIARSVELAH